MLTFGMPAPSRAHVVAVVRSNTPTSVAAISRPWNRTVSLAGSSGRFPEMSVKLAPPSVDSNTFPVPAYGTHRREKPDSVTKMWLVFDGSMVTEVMYRLGSPAAANGCHVPPTVENMPRWKPVPVGSIGFGVGLHGPHQPV